jgi:peptidoglycan/LPS O-acetylase OafA/YrhL
MKKSRVIQFIIAAALVTIGCVSLAAHVPIAIFTICFCLPSLVLMRPSQTTRPVARRDFWIMMAFLTVCAAGIILADLCLPKSAGEDFFRRPIFVVLLWVLVMLLLFQRWQRERKLSDT